MPTETLIALAAGRRMGVLEHAGSRLTFTYDPAWRAADGAYPLSLSMPLEAEQYTRSQVLPFLWGLLPDNPDVLQQWGRRFGVSPGNPFRLLQHVGEDCAGAVQFVAPAREARMTARLAPQPTWLTEADVAERLRELGRNAGAGRLATDAGQFSLAGAQRKTALHWNGRRWGIPAGATPTTHILKPAMAGVEGHPENEHLCLELARELGIPAARSHVEQFEDQVVIVVERFDRVQVGSSYLRVHQEDMCQATGVLPELKYENRGGPSALQVLTVLRECSREADEDVATFTRALVFQWLIGGTDAHAKNYAVLFGGGPRVRLAPLYDVASVLPYYPKDLKKLTLAMQVGGEYKLMRVGPARWRRFAAEAGLPEDVVMEVIRELCRALPEAYEKIQRDARRAGLTHRMLVTLGESLDERVGDVSRRV